MLSIVYVFTRGAPLPLKDLSLSPKDTMTLKAQCNKMMDKNLVLNRPIHYELIDTLNVTKPIESANTWLGDFINIESPNHAAELASEKALAAKKKNRRIMTKSHIEMLFGVRRTIK